MVKKLEEPLRSEVQTAFGESLRNVWFSTTAIAAVGFLFSLLMKSVPLHSNMDEQWGLEEEERLDRPPHDIA